MEKNEKGGLLMLTKLQSHEMNDTILQFASFLHHKGRKQSTIKRYAYDLEDCFRFFLKCGKETTSPLWNSFTIEDYNDYFRYLVEEKGYNEKTLHRIVVVLNQFYKYLQSEKPEIENHIPNTAYKIAPSRSLSIDDFISEAEEDSLLFTLQSSKNLSEKQLKARPFLKTRNEIMVKLMLYYGLSLREVIDLTMKDVQFATDQLTIHNKYGSKRTIPLEKKDRILLYEYFQTIPEPVRPHYHSNHPLFVAFDFNRMTFHWVYEDDSPKALTEIAFQKMLRLEVERADLRKGICSQHLRNTFILRKVRENLPIEEIMKVVGLKTAVTLKRYIQYAESFS
jgi:site-specific recombinase XerD